MAPRHIERGIDRLLAAGDDGTSIAGCRKEAARRALVTRVVAVASAHARYPAHPNVRRFLALTTAAALALAGCSPDGSTGGSMEPSVAPATAVPEGTTLSQAPLTSELEPLRLVALGDGYTAGTATAAPRRDSWPAQLAQAMDHGDLQLRLVDNLAEASHTSEDVERVQLPQVEALAPDVVTLQVGVNDIIARDISLQDYRANLTHILDELLAIVPARRIFLITTPDHTLTERGGDYGPRDVGQADVAEANGILADLAGERGLTVIDIAPVNQRVAEDASLVVGDGPYPSAKQYAGWVEIIGPQVRRVLMDGEP
jgi:lysophospholipase L1-like esterase